MSRRETALNVFLGAVLLSAVAAPFIAAGIGLHFAGVLLTRFYPAAAKHEDAILWAVFSASLLAVAVQDFVRSHWRAGFLELTSAAIIFLICMRQFEAGSGFDLPVLIVMVFVFTKPATPKQDMSRSTFLLATGFLCLAALAPVGLLTLGNKSRIVDKTLMLAACAFFVVKVRRGWSVGDDLFAKPSNPAPLS